MQSILQDQLSNLLDLIRFGITAFGLQIEYLLNARLAKNMMIASDSPLKSKAFEQGTQCVERHSCIGSTHYNMFIQLFMLAHVTIF